jgi:hypothetical protein
VALDDAGKQVVAFEIESQVREEEEEEKTAARALLRG